MACELHPGTCRREHIAPHLADATRDGTDFEARCPLCGHGGFRISAARVKTYRNVWTCACKRCGCNAHGLRIALLGIDVKPGCLGIYDGAVPREILPETARKMDLTIGDILAVPHLRPADIRIFLAEARGQMAPGEFGPFIKFAMSIGISKTQAREAAARWCRPSDCHPSRGGGSADTSRSTDASAVVKSPSSEARGRSVSDQETVGFRPSGKTDTRTSGPMPVLNDRNAGKSVSDQRTLDDKPGATFKPAA